MNSRNSPCDDLLAFSRDAGIDAIAITPAGPVDSETIARYNGWIGNGYNAGMDYLNRYPEIRFNPEGLLPGAQSIVCCAVSYNHADSQPQGAPKIASYAHGDDYHEVLREILENLAAYIRETRGGETRVCVDTAPIMERYWAWRSGLAFRGRSGLMIVPELGTSFFLGEIITTASLPAVHHTDTVGCFNCGKCIVNCPGKAIMPNGSIDARKCLSYLTIEHRGELPEGFSTGNRLYGCDECQRVCPHNKEAAMTREKRFLLRPAYESLTADKILAMTQEEFSTLFRRSAIKRAKLEGLKRNARHL
ncbi:MAG: tRNA epoxyqueuosine(34) reductase QueG [Bacteroidales bacterium]|nr:tRNA epoxyqueuosine(34) reductase QueG [Bacteroidales bacterium]